jgi:hypothetical protein
MRVQLQQIEDHQRVFIGFDQGGAADRAGISPDQVDLA